MSRVGFNAGDQFFWKDMANYTPFDGPPESWPDFFGDFLTEKSISDIVLYGDMRPIHAEAIEIAKGAASRSMFSKKAICAPTGSHTSAAARTEIRA